MFRIQGSEHPCLWGVYTPKGAVAEIFARGALILATGFNEGLTRTDSCFYPQAIQREGEKPFPTTTVITRVRQMAVLKGQGWNIVQSLKRDEEGPLELTRRIKVLVWDDEIEVVDEAIDTDDGRAIPPP
ncbi:hypothetical protein B0J17DRAFT_627810 [Rhizoctonia solani]|nr:hypothetical protein B0J17DRAFT_627810 [Rhizoctonia solani]